MQHRVLEIGAQELAHRHDVAIETDHEVSEGASGTGSSTLWSVWALTSNDTGMQIAHLGEEVLMITMELVHGAQVGERIGEMGMGDLRAGPGQPKKATEGSGDRVEYSVGKGVKLLVDERNDGGAVATEHRLEEWIIGEPHIDALGEQGYGCDVGACAD